MNYKDIYEELRTVLWADENVETVNKDEKGAEGYLPYLHNHGKINPVYHNRVLKIFKKFADKLYLETKDEYVIKLLDEACQFSSEVHHQADISGIECTEGDPEFMFNEYDASSAKEPMPEERYKLITKRINKDGSLSETFKAYRFYEEAKEAFDYNVSQTKEIIKSISDDTLNIQIDEERHFKCGDIEFILEKR